MPSIHSNHVSDSPQSFGVGGPALVNVQTLTQHVAYLLSDKIFTYSPESFELDAVVRQWAASQYSNAFGQVTGVQTMQTRAGAGNIALGYVFSPDFDLSKRHIPQSVIASSGALVFLREALNQLSLLHELANPFVAHIAAVEYVGSDGLVVDYVTPLDIANDLGLGLISSSSALDAQHMALLATALATSLPTLHVYDGVSSRDTVSAKTLLGELELKQAYNAIVKQLGATESKHSDREGKALRALASLNATLGTKYEAFEYCGHPQAQKVLITFGSSEALLSRQVVEGLTLKNVKIGVINVRLYRPFIEEEFLRVLPQTAKHFQVLGQVQDESQVVDGSAHSKLYQDVLATLTVAFVGNANLSVTEQKYARGQIVTHDFILVAISALGFETVTLDDIATQPRPPVQLSVWTLDDSAAGNELANLVPTLTGLLDSPIHSRISHDNLVQGGITRADITVSPNLSASELPIPAANVAYVGSDKILKEYDVVGTISSGGTLILSLPGVKVDDLEKKIDATVRQAIKNKNLRLQILDQSASSVVGDSGASEALLIQLTILHAVESESFQSRKKLVSGSQEQKIIDELENELTSVLRAVDIPDSWADPEEETKPLATLAEFKHNSFVPYKQEQDETASRLDDWIIAAKGAVFKEAYATSSALRPEAGVKTSVVTVKEHRRLTPASYDRNVFHIEFDLGDSGLTYAIGEALGIHAENDSQEVLNFIQWYGLDAQEVVQVPSREDHSILENRTIYQALKQNVDIFGRPPKRFYEALADFATDENDKKNLLLLSQPEGATEFKRRAEVDTITFADVLIEFPSARPGFHDLIRTVSPLKRREYSIASSQHVTPTSVALLIVTVNWQDPTGRDRFGLATRYLNSLKVGTAVTVSVKPSVMKLPPKSTAPIIMAGLGTGLAPFRAFVQERAYQKQVLGLEIGSVLLYLGSRHQREEYLYGEEWEAYRAAGIVTLIGAAFSRDQPQKIYIQDRMRQTMDDIRQAYLKEEGSFYLCGPTWPVPDVTEVLQETVEVEAKAAGAKKVDARREIETLKDDGRFVLEVY